MLTHFSRKPFDRVVFSLMSTDLENPLPGQFASPATTFVAQIYGVLGQQSCDSRVPTSWQVGSLTYLSVLGVKPRAHVPGAVQSLVCTIRIHGWMARCALQSAAERNIIMCLQGVRVWDATGSGTSRRMDVRETHTHTHTALSKGCRLQGALTLN
jgi:hypothetical protein